MKTKLTKKEIDRLGKLQDRIMALQDYFEESNIELHYGNGTVADQLDVANAAIESILQEFI